MTTPRLICLYSSGPGSGKTEVARLLRDNYRYVPVKLAGPLKAMMVTFLREAGHHEEVIARCLEGDLKEFTFPSLGRSPRQLMQTLGTEWGRGCIHPKVWTNIAVGKVFMENAARNPVVIDDMRFPNEFEALQEAGGVMVKVTRPGVVAPQGHPSEGLLDDLLFDYEIINNGTLDDLADSVTSLVNHASI